MYTVYYHDDLVCDYVVCFHGSLEECRTYVANDMDFWGEDAEELFIVAPDGFTVVE